MKIIFTIMLMAVSVLLSFGQSAPYTLTTLTNQPYQYLTDATNLTDGEVWDDPQLSLPLGFDFEIMGDTVQTLYIEDLFLGGILSTTDSESGVHPVFAAYGSDIIDRGGLTGVPLSPISWKLEGDVGSRIFKIEWRNAGFYEEQAALNTSVDSVNIQLWLHEGSNDIEIHFGPFSILQDSLAHAGFAGPIIGMTPTYNLASDEFDKIWLLTGDPTNPLLEEFDFNEEPQPDEMLQGNPAAGTVYRFSPLLVNVKDRVYESTFKIYPTITAGVISLENKENAAIHPETLEIRDMKGQIVISVPLSMNGYKNQIDLSSLASGVYLATVIVGNVPVHTQKIIKKER